MTRDAGRLAAARHAEPVDATELQQRGTRQILLARCLFFGVGYVITAIVARRLGAAGYGVYGVVVSQLIWLEILANAGVPAATATLLAEPGADKDSIDSSAQLLLLIVSAGLVGMCWSMAPFVAAVMHIPHGDTFWRIAVMDLPFAGVYAAYEGSFLGRRRFAINAFAIVIYSATKMCGIAVLLAIGFTVARVLVVSVASTAILAGVLLWRFPVKWRPRAQTMRRLASLSAPIAVYLVLGQILLNLDLWSLQAFGSAASIVGQYVASGNLSRGLTVIPVVQAGVLLASVSWAVAQGDADRAREHIQESSRFVVIIGACAIILLGIDARAVLSVLFSAPYAGGAPFLRFQLVGLVLFAIIDAFSHALQGAGKQRTAAVALAVTVPIAVFSNYVLIPRLGGVGAAISMVVGMSFGTLIMGVAAYRHFGRLVRLRMVVRVACAAALVGVLSAMIPTPGFLVLIKLPCMGAIYLLLLYLAGEVTPADFSILSGGRRPPELAASQE
jgi:O-antigen/teichoic acid export membrane protein